MPIHSNRLSPNRSPNLKGRMGNRGMHEKHQVIEEPYEAKVSRTVLKTSGFREGLAEFNSRK